MAPVIGQSGIAGQPLRRYILQEAGCFAQEFLQATTMCEGQTKVYLGLKVVRLGGADVSILKWDPDVVVNIF